MTVRLATGGRRVPRARGARRVTNGRRRIVGGVPQNRGVAIRFWLGVVQLDHVRIGLASGIAQFNHGSRAAVSQLAEADGVVYYSPRVSYPDGEPLRAFTAIGRVADSTVYQATDAGAPGLDGGSGRPFRPWRRRIEYDRDAVATPIRPLVGMLDFTALPNWGYQLRRGLIELSRHDFELIREQMRRPAP